MKFPSKVMDSSTTDQQGRHGKCVCMAQTTNYGSAYCAHNGTCYKNNPLHIKWWKETKQRTKKGEWD